MRKYVRVLTGLAVLLLLIGGAGVASAEPHQVYKCTQADGGTGCYEATGDYISASDTARDGAHVMTAWYVKNSGIGGICENYRGYGTRQTCQESTRVPEHATICFQLFVLDGNRNVDASPLKCLPTTLPANPT